MRWPGAGRPGAEPRIGAQLRAARLAARKSMAEVAEQSGLTKGFLSKLERDLTSVSVASLMRLCEALGISVGSLFQAAKGEVVRKGEYPPINFGGNAGQGVPADPGGRAAGAGDPERHRARRRQRRRAVLAADRRGVRVHPGRPAEIVVAGEQLVLDAGDAFTFPSSAEHTFQVPPSAGPTQVLWVFSPALPDHGLDVQRLAREQARAAGRR